MRFSQSAYSVQGELLIDGSFLSPAAFIHVLFSNLIADAFTYGESRPRKFAGACGNAVFQCLGE
jgi:hypothetical protein